MIHVLTFIIMVSFAPLVYGHPGTSTEHANLEKEYAEDESHRHRPIGFSKQAPLWEDIHYVTWTGKWQLSITEETVPKAIYEIGGQLTSLAFYDRDYEESEYNIPIKFHVDDPINSFKVRLGGVGSRKFEIEEAAKYDFADALNPDYTRKGVNVYLTKKLDYETNPTITFTVVGRDLGDPEDDIEGLWEARAEFIITVVDYDETINRAPIFTRGVQYLPYTFWVFENAQIGDQVEQLEEKTDLDGVITYKSLGGYVSVDAFDPDGDELTHQLKGEDASSFSLYSDSEEIEPRYRRTRALVTNTLFDYETKSKYDVIFSITDSKGAEITYPIEVAVFAEDADNTPPEFDERSYNLSVAEGHVGQFDILRATDLDGDTLTYSLSGDEAEPFFIGVHGGQLSTKYALNPEIKSLYTMTLMATDSKGGEDAVELQIQVNNVTPPPPPPPVITTPPPSTSGGNRGGGQRRNTRKPVVEEETSDPAQADETQERGKQEPERPLGYLENPGQNSFQSGIGVISGWTCDADEVTIEIDDIPDAQVAAYGTERLDTQDMCADTDNGFGLLVNWNLLGDGEHTVAAFVDGVELGRATVRVTTLGQEFLRGAEGECVVQDFPTRGETVTLEWQQNSQNFVVTDGE